MYAGRATPRMWLSRHLPSMNEDLGSTSNTLDKLGDGWVHSQPWGGGARGIPGTLWAASSSRSEPQILLRDPHPQNKTVPILRGRDSGWNKAFHLSHTLCPQLSPPRSSCHQHTLKRCVFTDLRSGTCGILPALCVMNVL